MRIDRIVLAVGTTEGNRAAALADAAADVAGPERATVHIVHVQSPAEFEQTCDLLDYDAASPPDPDVVARRSTAVRAVIGAFNARIREPGFAFEIHGVLGDDPGRAVTAYAEKIDADYLVVGGGDRSPVGKLVFGSTAQSIILDAPCPVTFVRDELADGDGAEPNRTGTLVPERALRAEKTERIRR